MEKIKRVTEIVDSKVKSQENHKIEKLQNYTREQIDDIFQKFSNQIFEIYWDQTVSFQKLVSWKDRSSFILEVWWKRIWILAFKNKLQKEDNCIENKNWYIEIKSFFLFDENWNWHIWKLWKEFLSIIQDYFNNPDWVYVTISKNKAFSSLNMFLKLWFTELYSVYNEYKEDWSTESHLYIDFNNDHKNIEFELPLKEKYLKFIKSWQKKTEWRSWKSFLKYKIWDSISFYNSTNRVTKVIKDIVRYNNLRDFLLWEWIENCLPWVSNLDQAIKIYESLPWYVEKIRKFWIIAFRF